MAETGAEAGMERNWTQAGKGDWAMWREQAWKAGKQGQELLRSQAHQQLKTRTKSLSTFADCLFLPQGKTSRDQGERL